MTFILFNNYTTYISITLIIRGYGYMIIYLSCYQRIPDAPYLVVVSVFMTDCFMASRSLVIAV